jgi:hypothetical protein
VAESQAQQGIEARNEEMRISAILGEPRGGDDTKFLYFDWVGGWRSAFSCQLRLLIGGYFVVIDGSLLALVDWLEALVG